MREWIDELDYYRGIAFLGVAMQHTLGVFIRQPGISLHDSIALGFLFNLVKFAVPSFLFISGLVMIRKYAYTNPGPSFYRDRAREILLPYLIWSVLYILYQSVLGCTPLSHDPVWYLHRFVTGSASYHLWFVVLILQFYILLPLFTGFFRRYEDHLSTLFMMMLFLGVLYLVLTWVSYRMIPLYAGHITNHWISLLAVKYRDRNILFWFYYILLGGFAGLYLRKWRHAVSRYLGVIGMLWVSGLIWVSYELFSGISNNTVNLNLSTTLKPSMTLFTFFSLMLVYSIAVYCRNTPGRLTSLLKTFGRYSWPAYLIHAMTLSWSVLLLRYLTPNIGQYPLCATLLAFLVCVFLALGSSVLLSNLPGSAWLGGLPKTKKSSLHHTAAS